MGRTSMHAPSVVAEKLGNSQYMKTFLDVATCRLCGSVMWKNEMTFIESHLRGHGIEFKRRYLFQ